MTNHIQIERSLTRDLACVDMTHFYSTLTPIGYVRIAMSNKYTGKDNGYRYVHVSGTVFLCF